MQLPTNIATLLALQMGLLQCVSCRTLVEPAKNSTKLHTLQRQNSTERIPKSLESSVVHHIVRRKRETRATLPYDFNTKHLPCDFDQNGRSTAVETFPNHCIWVWNNRYTHEGFYRVYKIYQVEAFFFGQYAERLKRYECDPQDFE